MPRPTAARTATPVITIHTTGFFFRVVDALAVLGWPRASSSGGLDDVVT
jgi:hypothetical protein